MTICYFASTVIVFHQQLRLLHYPLLFVESIFHFIDIIINYFWNVLTSMKLKSKKKEKGKETNRHERMESQVLT